MKMSKKVVIIGTGGHAKVIADIVLASGDKIIGFIDDNKEIGSDFIGYKLLDENEIISDEDLFFIVAIGNSHVRETVVKRLESKEKINWYTAIHPSATVSSLDTEIGCGTAIMANAVVNPGSVIGKHCILNTLSVVEHDNRISDYVHVSVGTKLAGTVSVGRYTWLGIGTAVSNNITICDDCMIGAGSVVVKDITESGTYVGVPARRIK